MSSLLRSGLGCLDRGPLYTPNVLNCQGASAPPPVAHRPRAVRGDVRHLNAAGRLRRLPAGAGRRLRVESRRAVDGALDQSAAGRRGGLRHRRAGGPSRAPRDAGHDGGAGRRRLRAGRRGGRAVAALPPRRRGGRHRHVELLRAGDGHREPLVRGAARAGPRPGAGRLQPRLHLRRPAGRLPTIRIGFVLQIVALIGVWWAPSRDTLLVALVLFGVGFAASDTMITKVIPDVFGMRALGAIMGVLTLGWRAGAALGPATAGFLYDLTGSYTVPFGAAPVAVLVSWGLFALGTSRRPG